MTLPIVPRVRGRSALAEALDLRALLWPIERAARSSRGRSFGRGVVAAVFIVALAGFSCLNLQSSGDPGQDAATASAPSTFMLSVHRHRGVGAPLRLEPSDSLPTAPASPAPASAAAAPAPPAAAAPAAAPPRVATSAVAAHHPAAPRADHRPESSPIHAARKSAAKR